MLHRSNYKARRAICAIISPNFYQKPGFPAASGSCGRYCRMASLARARDLRNLLSVAAKLRVLGDEVLCKGDQLLYLMAAEALEKRAGWLSGTLPEDHDQEMDDTPWLHQPVDLIV